MLHYVLGPFAANEAQNTMVLGRLQRMSAWPHALAGLCGFCMPASVFDPSRTKTPRKQRTTKKNHHAKTYILEFKFADRVHSKMKTRAGYLAAYRAYVYGSTKTSTAVYG